MSPRLHVSVLFCFYCFSFLKVLQCPQEVLGLAIPKQDIKFCFELLWEGGSTSLTAEARWGLAGGFQQTVSSSVQYHRLCHHCFVAVFVFYCM